MDAVLDMPRVRVTPEAAEIFGTRYDVAQIEGVEVRERSIDLARESLRRLPGMAIVCLAFAWASDWNWAFYLPMFVAMMLGFAIGDTLASRRRLPTELRVTTTGHGTHTAAWIEDRTVAERIADAIERARLRANGATV